MAKAKKKAARKAAKTKKKTAAKRKAAAPRRKAAKSAPKRAARKTVSKTVARKTKKKAPKKAAKKAPRRAAPAEPGVMLAVSAELDARMCALADQMNKTLEEVLIQAMTEFVDTWEDHLRTVDALGEDDDRMQLAVIMDDDSDQ